MNATTLPLRFATATARRVSIASSSGLVLASLCLLASPARAQAPAGMSLIDSAGKSFHMGDALDGGGQVHVVQLTKSFYLGQTEVTYAEWKDVRDWALTHGYTDLYVGQIGTDAVLTGYPGRPDTPGNRQHPMTNAKFWDVLKWCNAKSEREQRRPCFYLDQGLTTVMRTGTLPTTNGAPTPVFCDWSANGYRLPTSAEWEYAARGGVDDGRRFPWGDTITQAQANYNSTLPPPAYDLNPTRGLHPLYNGTSPVGAFPATGFGLYDMAGNISEWTWENTGTDYSTLPPVSVDPRGPDLWTRFKIARSGWFYASAQYPRCGTQDVENVDNDYPDYRLGTYGSTIGFRYALTFTKQPATVELSGLTHTYDGTPKSATVTTVPAGLTTIVTYAGAATARTMAGTYAVVAVVDDLNYEGSDSDTLSIFAQVTPILPAPPTCTAGEEMTLSVNAAGAPNCTYRWQISRSGGAWTDIPGVTGASCTIPSVQRFHAGSYRVIVTANGAVTQTALGSVLVDTPATNNARLLNLSTRALVQTGANVLIPGFVIGGSTNKKLLIRAVGPTLGTDPFNVPGVLPDPRIQLKRWDAATQQYVDVASNDNWGTNANFAEIKQTAAELGAFPIPDASLDAALLRDLAPGNYTVIADDVASANGIAIVELYDADSASRSSRLVNISNRGFCDVGDKVMIPGFVVSSEGPKTVLVRVVGPTLGAPPFNVPGTMADPKLTIYSGSTPWLENDNWSDNPDAAYTALIAERVFAFALNASSKDAALVVTLPPGSYTVVGSSASGTDIGVILVELYVVD